MQEMLLNVESKEIRVAHIRNGQLHDLIVERKKERQLTGNVYRGQVTNILHNIQSAFVDIGEGENGFIHICDIVINTNKFQQLYDLDFEVDYESKNGDQQDKKVEIDQVMKKDQAVLVQVIKEPIGTKGARLTSNISIAGRYLVLLPNSSHRGVSRKIEDRSARDRLKKLIRSFEMPKDMGLICRTASSIATSDQLIEEANELVQNWQTIMENFRKSSEPTLLYTQSDLIKRTVITAIDKRLDRLLTDDYQTFQICKKFYSRYSGEHKLTIELYRDKNPMFERFNVEREIEKMTRGKVWVASGGYLFFESTQAMHTIDVNSGRSGLKGKTDVEESIVRINLEAAEEIARQLRLRNVGGLIMCDFIDMRLRKNQRRVLERLKECVKEDSAKCIILGMSEFGLVQMTRSRNRGSLGQTLFTACPYCTGNGLIKSHESVSIEIERALKKVMGCKQQFALKLTVHPELGTYLQKNDMTYLDGLADEYNAHLALETNDNLHINDYNFVSTINNKTIEV